MASSSYLSRESCSEKRYFPSAMEQLILIQHMNKYFSFPERSNDRTKVAEEVTSILKTYSEHWTNRSVRLWFNNNKKSNFCHTTEISIQQQKKCMHSYSTPKISDEITDNKSKVKVKNRDASSDNEVAVKIPSIKDMDALLPKRDNPFPEHLFLFYEVVKEKQ